MEKIIVAAEDVWDYLQENIDDLTEEEHEIASNNAYGISVSVTFEEGRGFCISVYEDDEEIFYEYIEDSEEFCEDLVQYVYEEFVYANAYDDVDHEQYVNFEDRLYEREVQLDEATRDFLDVACGQDFFDSEVDDIKSGFLEYLSKNYDVRIYRPMIVEDEGGEEYIEDYPYEMEA